jgi:hypothetical protein
MRGKLTLLGLALALASPGCSLMYTGARVVSHEFTDCLDDACERVRNRKLAAAAWDRVCSTDPQVYSEDYGKGFREGFAEHLYHGGTQPPAVPPAHYRHISYQTPDGYRAIEAWFAGYRHGVDVAVETGTRRWITGPSGIPHAPDPHEAIAASGPTPHTAPAAPAVPAVPARGEPNALQALVTQSAGANPYPAANVPANVPSASRGPAAVASPVIPPRERGEPRDSVVIIGPALTPRDVQGEAGGAPAVAPTRTPPAQPGETTGVAIGPVLRPRMLAPQSMDSVQLPLATQRSPMSRFGLPLPGAEEPARAPTMLLQQIPSAVAPTAEESEPPTRLGGPQATNQSQVVPAVGLSLAPASPEVPASLQLVPVADTPGSPAVPPAQGPPLPNTR